MESLQFAMQVWQLGEKMGRKEGELGRRSLQSRYRFEEVVASPAEGSNELEGVVIISAK